MESKRQELCDAKAFYYGNFDAYLGKFNNVAHINHEQ